MEEVSFEKEHTIHLPDHLILLNFTNDSGAYYFDEWWFEEGEELFNKWVGNKEDE